MAFTPKSSLFTKITFTFFISLTILLSLTFFSKASTESASLIGDLTISPATDTLRDGNLFSYEATTQINMSSNTVIDAIYLMFWDEGVDVTLTSGESTHKVSNTYLQTLIRIPEEFSDCREVTISFDKTVNVSDVYAFTEGDLPDWVHVWQPPHDKADILLNSTHADDEQLFFAGVLPYHVAQGYRVQVVYFTDHTNNISRRHELLNGLWTVGVDHYPIISNFPDEYSTSAAEALNHVMAHGYTENDLIAFQTEIIRRFKPQVIVGHDIYGEYGHGQHMLNSATLIKAVELASSDINYPESAKEYGVWDTPKFYIHLYAGNQITLNWDEPLDYFGGKTAFQMSQEGYKMHYSQQYTDFTQWLNGDDLSYTKASQIQKYSPCLFGLYRTNVGADISKNSFFENLISYDEQERIEQEQLEQQRLEQERLEQERLAQEKIKLEQLKENEQNALLSFFSKENIKTKDLIAWIVLICSVEGLVVIYIKNKKPRQKRARRIRY